MQSLQSPYSKHWRPSWDILHPQLHLCGASTTNTAPELGERVWRESTFPQIPISWWIGAGTPPEVTLGQEVSAVPLANQSLFPAGLDLALDRVGCPISAGYELEPQPAHHRHLWD